VDAGLLAGSRVRFVGTATSGIDHVDTEWLTAAGIHFADAPGSNARSVAEYVLAAVLDLTGGRSPGGMSAAVIGCGHVGQRVIALFEALGIRCLRNDPPLKGRSGDPSYLDLDEVLAADIVTLHVPLTRSGPHPTWRLLDRARLARLRDDAILVNTARGGVIDEAALLDRAGLRLVIDCWEGEPAIDAALAARAAIGTAHIAGYSHDGKLRATHMIHDAACDWLGRAPFWRPSVEPQPSVVVLPGGGTDEDNIRRTVAACYDVRGDDHGLRQTLAQPETERRAAFDRLRRDYPRRREFDAFRIALPAGHAGLAGRLRALGFRTV
jgi:erythronate-4-phosphate dehydrogenase